MARRSARLASVSQTPAKTHTKASPMLDSVTEREDSPENDTKQSLPAIMTSPMRRTPRTPSDAALIKPPKSGMHPAKFHTGTMPAPSSALRLGFTDIKAKTTMTPGGVGAHQNTPSKSNAPSSPLAFSFNRTATDATLGPEALRMMNQIRDQAIKIKAELIAQREQERDEEDQVNARKIAHPKGKAGRYSAVHMSEFKKMDSIENHHSAFRAAQARAAQPAPSTARSLKRTQSKADLGDSQVLQIKTPGQIASSKSLKKIKTPTQDSDSPAKRSRKHLDDDASSDRPVSHGSSDIPRPPKTPGKDSRGLPRAKTLANLMSPTQASLARGAAAKMPTTAARSLLLSPSKINLTGLKKSATTIKLGSQNVETDDAPAKMRSTSLSDKIKSMFANHNSTSSAFKPGIPKPVATTSKTPAPVRVHKELPPGPFTTPGKKFAQEGYFTPAPQHAALAQNSPSPIKTGIPRSKAVDSLVNYPSLAAVMEGYPPVDAVIQGSAGESVSYPDLSGARPLPPLPTQTEVSDQDEDASPVAPVLPPAVPGTFSFRSDHTIHFDSASPKGFGGHYGQASVRQVRPSTVQPVRDAFPSANMRKTAGPGGKENVPPYLAQKSFDPKTFAHGVSSKKRYRVEDDEEEAVREASERAAKKAKSAKVPEGDALVAPRLASARKHNGIRTPSKIMKRSPFKSRIPAAAASPSVGHTTSGISKDRLAYLAQPKQRK